MKTEFPSKSEIMRCWFVLDASEAALGRVASKAAKILMGKHKPTYVPFMDTGDHVIVINADKAVLTGNKETQKLYRRHSGYPGGLTETRADKVRATRPIRTFRPSPNRDFRTCAATPGSGSPARAASHTS